MHPRKILVGIAGVDYQQKTVRRAPVNKQVVNNAALVIAHRSIERLFHRKFGDVVCHEMIYKAFGVAALGVHFAHVAYVKKPCSGAAGKMLVQETGVLHGHFPAAEFDDAPACADMFLINRGSFQHAYQITPRRQDVQNQ